MNDNEKQKHSEDSDRQRRGRWVLIVMVLACLGYALFVLARLQPQPGDKPGRYIVFNNMVKTDMPWIGQFDIMILDRYTGISRTLTDTPTSDYFSNISPDGKQLAYISDHVFYVANIESGESHRITGLEAYFAAWSPDGRWIGVTGVQTVQPQEDSQLWLVSPDGLSVKNLFRLNSYAFAWSPDGQYIATPFEIVHVTDGQVVANMLSGPDELPSWASDSRQVAYAAWAKDSIVINHLETGQERVITVDRRVTTVSWSPDGKILAAWNQDYRDATYIKLIDMPDGTQREFNAGGIAINGLTWSADSRSFVYTRSYPSEDSTWDGRYVLYLYDLDTEVQTPLTGLTTDAWNPVWSPR